MEDNLSVKLSKSEGESELVFGKMIGNTGLFQDPQLSSFFEDCYFNWIPESSNFDQQSARNFLNNLIKKSTVDVDDNSSEEELSLDPFKFICPKLSKAFLYLVLGEWSDATELLSGVKLDIDTAFALGPGGGGYYQRGFHCLRQGLEAFQLSLMRNTEIGQYLETCIPHKDLSKEDLLAVKAARAYFSYDIQLDLDLPVMLFKELCEEDPHQIIWKLKALWVMRTRRKVKNASYGRRMCSPEEKEIIVQCLEIEPDSMRVATVVLEFLGDLIKHPECRETEGFPIRLNDKLVFGNPGDIFDYVDNLVSQKDALANIENCLQIEQILCDISSYNSTWFKRGRSGNTKLSQMRLRCLNKALENMPDNSRVNHRMGNYYHAIDNNLDDALRFYKKAYDLAPFRNFPALMDVLKLLMRDLDRYEEELNTLFAEQLSNINKWRGIQRATIYWLVGIYYFVQDMEEECIKAWETAHKILPQTVENCRFVNSISHGGIIHKFLASERKKYRWRHKKLRMNEVTRFLQSVSPPTEMVTSALECIAKLSEKYRKRQYCKSKRLSSIQPDGRSSHSGISYKSNP